MIVSLKIEPKGSYWLAQGSGPTSYIMAEGVKRIDAMHNFVSVVEQQLERKDAEKYAEGQAQSALSAMADGDYGMEYER